MSKLKTFSLIVYSIMFLFLCMPSTRSLKNKETPCHQFSTCKCLFPTGRGINLNYINQNISVELHDKSLILLHLCEDVSFGTNVNLTNNLCQNVSICYMDTSNNISYSLGKATDMKIMSESQYRPISVQFSTQDRTTNINLICNEEMLEPVLIFKSIEETLSQTTYHLELESNHVCVHPFTSEESPPGGMSTGSVLVILFLMGVLVYFGGGMIALRVLRGAEGKEMIPHVDFWMDLPYLVRDGVLFALNGFQPPATYDRI